MEYRIDACPWCGQETYLNGPGPNDADKLDLLRRCPKCGKYVKVDIAEIDADTDKIVPLEKPRCYIGPNAMKEQRRRQKAIEKVEGDFNAWLDMINKVPKDYHTLNNGEWFEACRYFGGCALCDSKEMDSRWFFIPFKVGGRYCNWNVIPVCEKCSTAIKRATNPFRALHPRLGQIGSDVARGLEHYHNAGKRLDKIVGYLKPKLEAAANEE